MEIDVGSYADAVQEDENSKIPMNGTFDLKVIELPLQGEEVRTANGDPKMVFKLEVVNSSNPIFNGRIITHHTKIPSLFFTRILRAAKVEWETGALNTEEIAGAMYNKTLKCIIKQIDSDSYPNIKSFIV